MNTLGKILVVFTTAASLGFAAFAASLAAGGPNWSAIVSSPSFSKDYSVVEAAGPPKSYTAKNRVTDEQVGQSTVLPEVLLKARQKQVQDLRAQLDQTTQAIEQVRPRVVEVSRRIEADLAGAEARLAELQGQLTAMEEAIQTATETTQQRANEAQQIRAEAQERRDEGFRLRNQLELLRNDLFAAQKQRDALADELVRLNEISQRLERRNAQLQQQLEGGAYDEATANATSN